MATVRPLPFSAVLLAGGFSTRMGRDKALLDCGGRPLWRRQWELLAETGAAERFLSARAEQTWLPADAARVSDAEPGLGPASGIAAALSRCMAPHLAVLAVDLPRMEAAWFERLLVVCAAGRGAVGRRGKLFEPLAAVYPREIAPALQAALARREPALQPLIARAVTDGLLAAVEIMPAEARLFDNWNAPADIQA